MTYPDSAIWELVKRTEAHPQYEKQYSRLPSNRADWVKMERKMPSGTAAVMIGLDCEMAATTEDDRALTVSLTPPDMISEG